MSLDRTTESIAHFVGLFHMAVEDNRLRDQYIEFKRDKDDTDDEAGFEFKPVRIATDFKLNGYSGKVVHSDTSDVNQPGVGQGLPSLPAISQSNTVGSFTSVEQPPEPLIGGSIGGGGGYKILPYVPIPPQTITITLQSITLIDNDILGDPAVADFISRDVFLAELETLLEFSEVLQPWTLQGLATAVLDDPGTALEFMQTLAEVDTPPEALDLSAYVLRDSDATGTVINGVPVEERPEIDDFLPTFIRLKRDDDAGEQDDADAETPPDRPLSGTSKDLALLHETDDGFPHYDGIDHNVVTGANESHNAAWIYTNWIDATVFAVAGNTIELNAISQTNILFDQDVTPAGLMKIGPTSSQAKNIASISYDKATTETDGKTEEQKQPDTNTDDGPAPIEEDISASETGAKDSLEKNVEESGGKLGLPSVWNLETVEGDVTFTNIVQQHTFMSDADQLNLTFTANSTTVSTGENLAFNQFQANEFGFGYDLVLVGGSMTTMNIINQTNVLLDNDYFSGAGLGKAAVSSNDNSLVNDASITKHGVDEQKAMLDDFKTALEDLSAGAKQLGDYVAKSALFEGLEALRALYISGDLTQLNIVDQINTIGDQDQVHMAAQAMMSAIEDSSVAITTGSNYLTNTASIDQDGIDSTIMAAGEQYSDAMLYQAELIDTEANPLGVNISQLTNEAVAIIVDDLTKDIAQTVLEQEAGGFDLHTGGTSLDVMQTMTG
ncbi:MAG: hypothetical protein RID11_01145 [Roseovarius sp.]|uniref:hypothetical protein n=1 Tax=Roseovarius sp. TaxID=1486281 RepID=UPI0032EC4778